MLESSNNTKKEFQYAGSLDAATNRQMVEGWWPINPQELVNLPNTYILMKFDRNGRTSVVKPQNRDDVLLENYCVLDSTFEILQENSGNEYSMKVPELGKKGSCEALGGKTETFYYLKGYSVYYLGCAKK